MFCRLGPSEFRRPVAATNWLKVVWMRPVRSNTAAGSAST